VVAPKYTSSKLFGETAVYPIIFGDLNQAMAGSADGYHKFNGDKQRLAITTPSNGQLLIQYLNFPVAATAGSVNITYRGETVNVAWNATAAEIQSALRNLSTLVQDDRRLVVGSSFDVAGGGGGLVVLQDPKPVRYNYPITVQSSLTSAGAFIPITSTVNQEGRDGWLGTTYDVSIYSLYFRSVHQNQQKLYAMDLV